MDNLKKLRKKLQKTRSKMINQPQVRELLAIEKKDGKIKEIRGGEYFSSFLARQIPDALDRRTKRKGDKILKKIKDIKKGPGKAMADLEYQLDLADKRNDTLPAVPPEGQYGTNYKTGESYEKSGTLPAIRRYNVRKKNEGGLVKGFGASIKPRKFKVY